MDSSCPDDFRCPISLEIMTDPVILPSGHTFDRSSIQRWLDGGNLTCPVTNLPLPSPPPPLIPNHALRRLISNSNPAPKQPQKPPPCPNKFLSSLKYPSDSVALSSLLRSVQKSAEFRQKVADSSIPKALIRHVADPQLPELQKLAIYSLLYLSLDGDDVKVGLVAEGAVESLVTAVKSGSGAAAAAAAAATVITSLATVDVNKVTIGAHPSAIGSLATMLLEGSGKREKKEAATALYELCKFPENRRRLIRVAGSVRSLAELAGSGLDRAVEVLAQLGKIKEGRADMGRIQGFVRVLVGVLERGSARGVESAISVLNLVCSEDERLGLEAMNEGVLGVLERLSNEEGGKIGKNSAALLEKLKRGIVNWV